MTRYINVKLINGTEIVGELISTEDNTLLVIKNPCTIAWKTTSTGESMNLYRYNAYSLDGNVVFNMNQVISIYDVFDHLVKYYIQFITLSNLNANVIKDQLDKSTSFLNKLIDIKNEPIDKIEPEHDDVDMESSYYDWILDNLEPPSGSIN